MKRSSAAAARAPATSFGASAAEGAKAAHSLSGRAPRSRLLGQTFSTPETNVEHRLRRVLGAIKAKTARSLY